MCSTDIHYQFRRTIHLRIPVIQVKGSSTDSSTWGSSESTCMLLIPGECSLNSCNSRAGNSWLPSQRIRACSRSSSSLWPAAPQWRHEGETCVVGISLGSLFLVGRIPHCIWSRYDDTSGPRPFSLASRHDLGQSVVGSATSHFRGRRHLSAWSLSLPGSSLSRSIIRRS